MVLLAIFNECTLKTRQKINERSKKERLQVSGCLGIPRQNLKAGAAWRKRTDRGDENNKGGRRACALQLGAHVEHSADLPIRV